MFKLITKSKIDMKKMRLLPSAVLAANLLLAAVFFVGCGNEGISNQQKSNKLIIETGVEVNGYVVSVIEFDSCQYLVSGIGYSQMMTHKGNCKFCAARHSR
jgi:YbbR domain-containing protein